MVPADRLIPEHLIPWSVVFPDDQSKGITASRASAAGTYRKGAHGALFSMKLSIVSFPGKSRKTERPLTDFRES